MGHKDLRLGQIVYILVFYNISFSWFLPLDGFQFNFLLRDSENDLLVLLVLPLVGLCVASGWPRSFFWSSYFPRSRPLGLDSAWLEASRTQGLCVFLLGQTEI